MPVVRNNASVRSGSARSLELVPRRPQSDCSIITSRMHYQKHRHVGGKIPTIAQGYIVYALPFVPQQALMTLRSRFSHYIQRAAKPQAQRVIQLLLSSQRTISLIPSTNLGLSTNFA